MLLDEFKSTFKLMERTRTSDGAGGFLSTWKEGESFDIYVQHDTTVEAQKAEKEDTASTYTFLFNKNIALDYHDVVKRVSDGQVFLITSKSGEDYTPASSKLNLSKAAATKWELTT